jgi:hypothetical protein
MSPGEIDKWIYSRRPIILRSRREARRHSTSSVRLLPTFFHPLQRSRTPRRIRTDLNPTPASETITPPITAHFRRILSETIRRRPRTCPSTPPQSRRLIQAPFEFHEYPP